MLDETIVDAFPASDDVNGVMNRERLKVLLCYAIGACGAPVRKSIVLSAFYVDRIANYFEVCSAISELTESGALAVNGAGDAETLALAEGGRQIIAGFIGDVSDYMKDKVANAVRSAGDTDRRLRENTVVVSEDEDGGARLNITMYADTEKQRELLSLSITAASTAHAESLGEAFLKDPTRLYKNVITALSR